MKIVVCCRINIMAPLRAINADPAIQKYRAEIPPGACLCFKYLLADAFQRSTEAHSDDHLICIPGLACLSLISRKRSVTREQGGRRGSTRGVCYLHHLNVKRSAIYGSIKIIGSVTVGCKGAEVRAIYIPSTMRNLDLGYYKHVKARVVSVSKGDSFLLHIYYICMIMSSQAVIKYHDDQIPKIEPNAG